MEEESEDDPLRQAYERDQEKQRMNRALMKKLEKIRQKELARLGNEIHEIIEERLNDS